MSSQEPLANKDAIVIGRPLPFSIYSADRKLLLAQGQMVESERLRDALLRVGRFQSYDPSLALENATGAAGDSGGAAQDCLAAFARECSVSVGQAGFGVRMARDDATESYTCWIIGTHEQRGLILTAPSQADHSLVKIAEGEAWVFRMLYMTAAFRFVGSIEKVQLEPFPHIHVSVPRQLEMRQVRRNPRAPMNHPAVLETDREIEALIVDMSVGGARVALSRGHEFGIGQTLLLSFSLTLLGNCYQFRCPASIVAHYGATDSRYPQVNFWGLKLEPSTELDRLALHGYVHERLAVELDGLWQLLANSA